MSTGGSRLAGPYAAYNENHAYSRDATVRGLLKAGCRYQIEKSIAVGIISVGAGVIGLALAVILRVVGVDSNDVTGDSVGLGALGFLLAFIVACCAYAVLLPRAGLETLDRR